MLDPDDEYDSVGRLPEPPGPPLDPPDAGPQPCKSWCRLLSPRSAAPPALNTFVQQYAVFNHARPGIAEVAKLMVVAWAAQSEKRGEGLP